MPGRLAPYLVRKGLVKKKGIARILGSSFILPTNREKKWEVFVQLTDHLLPQPSRTIRYQSDRCAVIVELRRHLPPLLCTQKHRALPRRDMGAPHIPRHG